MEDDDFAAFRPRQLPADLQSWNLEDLKDYIVKLQNEIARVEDKIKEKQDVTSAAASLFKS